ncbi:hypothetical protein FNYG_14918 [Fusarium nygamai]|uniref:Uncharacterized protein n=1 Tax=Gibberella nygamai TaxID=42673 RepID=A0A2K0UP35_GIBNY|nr:hypothetical protein FNYG_14918 [Fusarium nygamai]
MFDNAAVGISGKLTLESVSPAHYPCHINKPGVSEEIIPPVFWSNAIPDAVATADFIIKGKLLNFTGNGYHDKNWGTKPIREVVKSWYWGHGRVGPYSIVWFDTLTPDGKEHFSSWITKDGKVVSQSCKQEFIVVRPWGENSDYPPPPILPPPSGYSLRYDMAQGQTFVANFTSETIALATDTYKRMVGPIVGGIEGDKQYEGRALCEQFQF